MTPTQTKALLFLASVLVAATFSVSPAVASAAGWSLLRSSLNTNTSRPGVSCASSSECVAVNSIQSESSRIPSASFWNGEEWSANDARYPAGAVEAYLNGVSCVSSVCLAVGHAETAPGVGVTLAEYETRLERGSWAIQETPNPAEAVESSLAGVSCVSEELCTAVGYYYTGSNDQKTLAERWDGKEWAVQETPNPKEANESGLLGSALASVSCASAESCTAVGSYYTKSLVQLTLVEHWNGKAWAIQATPNPKEAIQNSLAGVSCVSSESCIAAGQTTTTLGEAQNLTERFL
jgi:hypothetical protein